MKSITKSNHLDYTHLYNTLLSSIIFSLLYIGINFFLPLGDYFILFLLAIGIFCFIFYFFNHSRTTLLCSLGSTLAALMVGLIFLLW